MRNAAFSIVVTLLLSTAVALAQNAPTTGPTNPSAPAMQPNVEGASPATVGQAVTVVNPANPQDRPNPNPQDKTEPNAINPQDQLPR